jgi:hypothetical protein
MGALKPQQVHRVTLEVTGRKMGDVTKYMKKVRQLAKSEGARVLTSKKSTARRKAAAKKRK